MFCFLNGGVKSQEGEGVGASGEEEGVWKVGENGWGWGVGQKGWVGGRGLGVKGCQGGGWEGVCW